MKRKAPKDIKNVERPLLLHAARLDFASDWRMKNHSHDGHHEMIVLLSGAIRAETPLGSVEGKAGQVLHYAMGLEHQEVSVGLEPVRMICIAWLGDASGWPAVIDDTHGRLLTLANWLMDYLPARDPADWHRADTVMAAVALECTGQVRQRVDPGIREVQRHVRDNLAQPHSLASLAQIAGVSPFHFAREFKAQTGQTVMGFVRRTRVEVARGYLLSSQLPLKAIASRVGFADAFQLSRVYRKVAGYPPGQERRSTGRN